MLKEIQEQLVDSLTGSEEQQFINTPVNFSMKVEFFAMENGCTLLESLAYLVEEHELDAEQVPKLLTLGLKEKLAFENGIEKSGPALNI